MTAATQKTVPPSDDGVFIVDTLTSLNACVDVGWVVSKAGHHYKVTVKGEGGAIQVIGLESGTTSNQTIQKFLENGYIFTPPANADAAPQDTPAATAAATATETSANVVPFASDPPANVAPFASDPPADPTPNDLAGVLPFASDPPTDSGDSSPAGPAQVQAEPTSTPPGAEAKNDGASRVQQLERELAERLQELRNREAQLEADYQKKIAEAKRKAKPLGQRRIEAFEVMECLRAHVRAGLIDMSDDEADAAIAERLGVELPAKTV